MDAKLRKVFSGLKSKCDTSTKRRAYNELIRTFASPASSFNECSLKIAEAWDNLYRTLRCRKSLYGHGGDTCYMYITGKDSSGKSKILARILDWSDIVLFVPADATKGTRFRGSVKDLYSQYNDLYMFPSLYTEPSLYNKLNKCYAAGIIGHYVDSDGSFSSFIKQFIANTDKIVGTINEIAKNPKSVYQERIVIDRKNFPEVYKFFDELVGKVDLFSSQSNEEFTQKLGEINEILKSSKYQYSDPKKGRGYIECVIPDLDGYDWRIDIGSETISITPNDPMISTAYNELGAEFYDWRSEIQIKGDYDNAKSEAIMKKTVIPFK